MAEHHSKLESKDIDSLFEAILTLENIEECYRFFEDICTINELQAISQRLEVAKMLSSKKTYLEIADKTGEIGRASCWGRVYI